jgi:hypothetical protein
LKEPESPKARSFTRHNVVGSEEEADMEEMLLNLTVTHSQAETVRRWLAMSIVTAPHQERRARYMSIRERIAELIMGYGMDGIVAEECLRENMQAIRVLVSQLEARLHTHDHAHAA